MKFIVSILCFVLIGSTGFCQDIDAEAFKTDILALYNASKKSLTSVKDGASVGNEDGRKKYNSRVILSGSKTAYILEDDEKTNTYIATYTFKNVRTPSEKVDEIVHLIHEATAEFGLEIGKATDIKYVGYQKKTIEFPSDNIDDMGKYPSFHVGLVKDGNPMELEVQVNEILWK